MVINEKIKGNIVVMDYLENSSFKVRSPLVDFRKFFDEGNKLFKF